MGEVPINPTGFAHGFRPIENAADHPPPTPTQRNITQQGDEDLPGGLSAVTQTQAAGLAPVGVMGAVWGSSKKRRRLPGPLAFLQQGGSG